MLDSLAFEIARNLLAGWAAGLLIGVERTYNGRSARISHPCPGRAGGGGDLNSGPAAPDPGGWRSSRRHAVRSVPLGPGRNDRHRLSGRRGDLQGRGQCPGPDHGRLDLVDRGGWADVRLRHDLPRHRRHRPDPRDPDPHALVGKRRPWRVYAQAIFRFEGDKAPSEQDLGRLLDDGVLGVGVEVGYKLVKDGQIFEYWTNIETKRQDAFMQLSAHLRTISGPIEYEVSRVSK